MAVCVVNVIINLIKMSTPQVQLVQTAHWVFPPLIHAFFGTPNQLLKPAYLRVRIHLLPIGFCKVVCFL